MDLKKKILSLFAGITLGLTTFIGGCGEPTFKTEFKDEIKKKGATEDMASVGYVDATRIRYMEKQDDGTYKPNYKIVGLKEQIEQLKGMKKDLDELLSTNPEIVDYVDEFGLEVKLKKKEKVTDYRLRTLESIANYLKFQKLMGYMPDTEVADKDFNRYDITILHPDHPIHKKVKIQCKEVDASRFRYELEKVETFKKFLLELKNPAYPYVDRLNPTIKKEVSGGLVVVSYDIDNPKDEKVDYIEIYRKKSDGKLESKPALRVFKSVSSSMPNVVVIDMDKEGKRGFGQPDIIEGPHYVRNGSELLREFPEVIDLLLKDDTKYERIRELKGMPKIEIVPVGKLEEKLWVANAKGYTIPVEYKYGAGDNYLLELKADEQEPKEKDTKVFLKRYHVPGDKYTLLEKDVVEYFKFKPEFKSLKISNMNISEITTKTGKDYTLRMVLENGEEKTGLASYFLEKDPFMIAYTHGKFREYLKDADGKDPKYELKKRVAKPIDVENNNSDSSSGSITILLGK